MSDPYVPFGSQQQDVYLAQRVGQLEAENAWLRKRVKRYNRGSWVLGILLFGLWALRFVAYLSSGGA